MSDNNEVEVIPIDPDSRYVILATDLSGSEVQRLHEIIEDWWKSDAKFCLLGMRDGAEIKLERVDA